MRTAVVILNWNTKDYLSSFLPPLIGSLEGMDAGVVVADNGSTDGSRELLSERFPEVKTILLDENYGFTGGYDRAVGQLLEGDGAPEYIVLMNSDIEVDGGWLQPLVDYMDRDPWCGACGPKLHALDRAEDGGYVRTSRFEYAGAAGGRLDRLGFPYCRGRVLSRTEEDCGQYDRKTDVAWVTGACLMTRAELWKRLGGLDGRFFAHMEEIDYCWRLWLEGFRVSVVPQSTVWHLGGGTLPQTSPRKLMLNYRNGLLMLDDCLPLTVGRRRAKCTIALRKAVDCLAALAYILTFRFSSARAVFVAHAQFRRMRNRKDGRDDRRRVYPGGLSGLCIIPQAMLRGNGIFEYLRRYEDSH